MISTTLSGATSLYAYNGDGARLKQTVAGTVTTYTQDLAAPLPVILQARTGSATTQYLYSIGTRPLGQYTSAWEYLLPDALGSVRQIVDANGNVTLAKSYEPYGTLLTSVGTASSIFGYAGEQIDTTGLIYLRARYMNPRLGLFLARDPWSGDILRPGSMNGFNYVEGNPVNEIDPGGSSPWSVTPEEGTLIHRHVIEPDFLDWGKSNGFLVRVEFPIPGGSKNRTGNAGAADLMDQTNGEIYEIKSERGGGVKATKDAQWYVDYLNKDLGSANIHWKLGSRYLKDTIKDLGEWPLYPNYNIKATLLPLYPDDSHTGAILYWGERNSKQDPERLRNLAYALKLCELLVELLQGGGAPVLAPAP